MIRQATVDDIQACVEMSRAFWKHTAYTDAFDENHVESMVCLALDCQLLLVLEIDGSVEGFAAAISQPLLANAAVIQVTELAYWINKAHRGCYGLVLIHELEQAAKDRGAAYINMIAMESSSPDVAEAIYKRCGYQKIETTYCKRLKGV